MGSGVVQKDLQVIATPDRLENGRRKVSVNVLVGLLGVQTRTYVGLCICPFSNVILHILLHPNLVNTEL